VLAAKLLGNAVYEIAHRSGFNALMRAANRWRLLVLCYHSVISDSAPDDPRTNIAVTKSQFESQLSELRRNWTPIKIDDLLAACHDNYELPANSVLVTFDDGFRNNLLCAAPILARYEIPPVVFLTAGLIGTGNLLWTQDVMERVLGWPDRFLPPSTLYRQPLPDGLSQRLQIASAIVRRSKRLLDAERRALLHDLQKFELRVIEDWQHELYDFLSWDEVKELMDAGFSIGGHTIDHPNLASLSSDELKHQLSESRHTICCETNSDCEFIAYPNGGPSDFSDEVIRECTNAGFRLGFTLCESRNPKLISPMKVDRLCITRDQSMALFKARLANWR
jgi:peptidoglycan/xylan/chitin deacetylase (PgdA/CDA1 family)